MAKVYNFIKGRFGNQLFQYWTGQWIAEQLGKEHVVYFSHENRINTDIYHNVRLNCEPFRVPAAPDPAAGIYTGYENDTTNAVDIDPIVETHRGSNRDLFLNFYAENYFTIRPREEWVQKLYERHPRCALAPKEVVCIHIRLGDIEYHSMLYLLLNDAFINFMLEICRKENLPALIVSEEPAHIVTQELLYRLRSAGIEADIAPGRRTFQDDFDLLCSARALILGNSTFSWWAAFLNPFKPRVYVALSIMQAANWRNKSLFQHENPDGWVVADLDDACSIVPV